MYIPLSSIYTKELKPGVQTQTCTQMFTAALFMRAKGRNNPNVQEMMTG